MSFLGLLTSAFGVNMQGMPRGQPLGGPRGKFSQKYHAYSPAYWNSENRDKLEQGDKIVIPASALEQLSRLNVQFPIMFRITHDSEILPKQSHCSVLEFTAPEGEVYLPLWMIDNLGLDAMGNSVVLLETVSLPKGTFVQFQAHETKFAMLMNPKAVLEKALRSYSCLTVGDTIQVTFADYVYKLDVTKVEPSRNLSNIPDSVSIIETDIKVDFLEPRDYNEYQKKQKQNKKRNQKFVEEKDTTFKEEFEDDDDDWVIDPQKHIKQKKQLHFNSLKLEGSKPQKLKRGNSSENSNNNNKTYNQSTVLPSKTRGIPLGGKIGITRQLSSPNKPHVKKVEEIVGNMRYIYEIDEFGTRKCVRRLPVRKHDFKGQGKSLKS